jgi:hypothetical protein
MKKLTCLFLLAAFAVSSQNAPAQSTPQSKPASDDHSRPSIPIKVQLVFSEYDGDKKVSSMPYSFIAITDEKFGGHYSTSLRTGVRIPVEVGGADQKTSYMDVGSNIDCGVQSTDDNRYHLYLVFERSALYTAAPEDKLPASHPASQPPLIRQFRASVNTILRDGQTTESVVSTDPLNGHSLHVSTTVNAMK